MGSIPSELIIYFGVTVLFNVDATNLNLHPSLQNKKFTKVIFNFPHVGGKMKIHLNRKLLKDFFSSACDVLNDDGSIVVALCDGQGGTEADKKKRRWDDSWQITEMAAQSDLILHQIEPFDVDSFPNYVNIGYRSGDKSFHCKNAIVHTFKKQKLPAILKDFPDRWIKDQNIREDLIFEFLDDRMTNPLHNPQSASSYIFDTLSNKFLFHNFNIHNTVLTHNFNSISFESEQVIGSNSEIEAYQQLMLQIYLELIKECVCKNVVARVSVKKAIIKDFSKAPVRCQMVVFGMESKTSTFLELLSQMFFNSEWQLSFKDILEEYQCAYIFNPNDELSIKIRILDVIKLKDGTFCHICHIDELAQQLFGLDDWRSLWNGNVCSLLGCVRFRPISISPREFSFDLGLSVPLSIQDKFEEQLFLSLWLLAGDIITKTELLTTYLPSDRELICFCYRITYKSFNAPICRKRVIYIHEKIIAKLISKSLQVNIT